ncbi:hypothetical protein [Enterobacter wuhouensis]|uniref:hypothetical protein n=1 Tax=Enterobacter wuhouensis TaxID=2529381 RepID=UPI003526438F
MIGTAREIALQMLSFSDLDGEKFVYASWNRDDIRCICLDWDLSNEELDEVLSRLSSCLESGADIGQIRSIVEVLLDERHEKRAVTVPAKSLATAMQLAGKEMERLACSEGIEALKEKKEVLQELRIALNA